MKDTKMETTFRKHRWFWGWDDDREEAWLRQMAQSGFHLVSVAPIGNYTFRAGPKEDIIYRLDFQLLNKPAQREEYQQLFRDAGWEHVSEMANWQYFSKPASAPGSDEIFTDNTSKAKKYQRLALLLGFFYIIMVSQANSLVGAGNRYDFYRYILVFYAAMLIFYTYALVRLLLRIRRLRMAL